MSWDTREVVRPSFFSLAVKSRAGRKADWQNTTI
jgi:hypothetical protein